MRRFIEWGKRGALTVAVFCFATAAWGQSKYQQVPVSDGGSISGRVLWSGAAPELTQFAVTTDAKVCSHGAAGKTSPRLILGPGNGVRYTVVSLVDVTQGKPMLAGSKKSRLDQKGCEFLPHVQVVPVGGNLDIVSSDDVLHNVHMTGAATYNLAFPVKNMVVPKPLSKPGLVELVCDLHEWMSAYVYVSEHPYYTVTDSTGVFTLDKVPPGTYTIRAWHEGWKVVKTEKKKNKTTYVFSEPVTLEQKVTVPSGGKVEVKFELSDGAKPAAGK
jgi:plastocyanin